MNVEQIKNISDLIELGSDEKITSHTVKRLTAPGENYGSLMLSVDISISTPNGPEELHTVAKMVPPNEFIQEVFNTQVTFRNEIGFYKEIVPLLQNFQKEKGIVELVDFAAQYLGSRLNLNKDASRVDSDAALVLENLKVSGYQTLNRMEGLDFDAAELVLENLAHFHAVPLALRLQKPEIFETVIQPYLKLWTMKDEQLDNITKDQLRLIDEVKEVQHLTERILQGLRRMREEGKARDPFATIVHNDCWVNNNMFKLAGGKVVKSKIVDYQILSYGSPAKDVVFFLFSSVKSDVIKKHYDRLLLKQYHQTFIKTLKELGCDVTPYTFERLLEEIDVEAKESQFGHLAFMLLPIFAPEGTVKEISEMSVEDMTFKEVTDNLREKYVFLCNEFAQRGWI